MGGAPLIDFDDRHRLLLLGFAEGILKDRSGITNRQIIPPLHLLCTVKVPESHIARLHRKACRVYRVGAADLDLPLGIALLPFRNEKMTGDDIRSTRKEGARGLFHKLADPVVVIARRPLLVGDILGQDFPQTCLRWIREREYREDLVAGGAQPDKRWRRFDACAPAAPPIIEMGDILRIPERTDSKRSRIRG